MRNTATTIQHGVTITTQSATTLKVVASNICFEERCRRRKQSGKYCNKHAKQHYKQKHYGKYTYNLLKSNAKRRGKDFQLTYEEFMQFCATTGYLEKKGKLPFNYSIDRKDHTKGYTFENIQVLTYSENCRKGYYEGKGVTDYNTDSEDEEPF